MKLVRIRIPPDGFLMGSRWALKEKEQHDEEQHLVELASAFYMGVYEVTQEEYQRVMGTNPSYSSPTGAGKEEVAGLNTARFPVEQVRWTDAKELCRRLSQRPAEKQAEREYRLPTEAEWEYACRAGTQTTYYFGEASGPLDDHAWHTGNAGIRSHAVGDKQPNPWGLHDMYGNVWEWCANCYDDTYYGTRLNAPVERS
jgi:formylglycine-generating enzyme required for sulfatase activity